MRIVVAIASVGRPRVLIEVVSHLRLQKRQADEIVVVGSCEEDVKGLKDKVPEATIIISAKGLCKQRNAALDYAQKGADLIVFFDDDFVPHSGYLAALEENFCKDPQLVGATGQLAGDGAKSQPYDFRSAVQVVDEVELLDLPVDKPARSLYGCNMTVRTSAINDLRFDEKLPLYGWLEDIDFTQQIGRRGRMMRLQSLTGVHMGVRGGRTSGIRLGYSQIANVVYLYRKGTMQTGLGRQLVVNNVFSNLIGLVKSERHIDRRGRLLGNILASWDFARGRIDPEKVLRL